MYFVYVLWSESLLKRYVGSTDDVDKRLVQHNRRESRYTKRGVHWIVIHKESFSTKTEALKRENFLKSGAGRKWLDKIYPQYSHKRKGAGVA